MQKKVCEKFLKSCAMVHLVYLNVDDCLALFLSMWFNTIFSGN